MGISDQIRDALRNCDLSIGQIAKLSGVSKRAVSDFLAGRDVRATTLDRLAEFAGAEMRIPKKKRKSD